MRLAGIALIGSVSAVYVFLLLPTVIVVVASVNAAEYLSFPPAGFSLRWYRAFFASSQFMEAFWLSIEVGIAAAFLATLIGTPAAIFYVRFLRVAREQFRFAVLSPLLLPEVLTAIALLFFFNQILGGTSTLLPLVIGHVVITLPFVFLTVTSALYNMPAAVEEAARTLGAGPWKSFFRVTLPLIRSGVITGALLAFIMSFDNVNISLLLKAVGTTTLPIQLFDYLRYDFDPTAAAASTVSVALTMALLVVIDRLYGLRAVRF
jgi:putative spermidine/putrescine transport system permease protein